MTQSLFNKTMVAAAMTFAVAGFTAADDAAAGDKEKCFGVSKAGKNDCGGRGVSCAGHATKDGQGFIAMPKGLCERLAGGSLTE